MEKERERLHISVPLSTRVPCLLNAGPTPHSALSLGERRIGATVPAKGRWEDVGGKGVVREEAVRRGPVWPRGMVAGPQVWSLQGGGAG